MRLAVAFLVLVSVAAAIAQTSTPRPPAPLEPIAAILEAFRTHDLVAVSDPHGNVQMQAFLLALVRAPQFADAVDGIVIETASARYQDAIDRFVRGDDLPRDVLRKAWEEHTVPNSGLGTHTEEFIRAVRAVNASLGGNKKLRVIAGDPPIDWDNVTSREDHRRWIEVRDTYPADVIRRQILDRGQKALVIYGQGHLQRRQIVSNYDMSTWQAQTVISLLARDLSARLFTVWTLFDRDVQLPDPVASWPVPSLAATRGTTLGAADFAIFNRGLGDGTRFAVRSGQLVPLPREAWQTMRMEDQFDALLYLGPPSAMTNATIPAALCRDQEFITRRLERLERFAPPVEVENLKKACGL
jgi:hypothetical protein